VEVCLFRFCSPQSKSHLSDLQKRVGGDVSTRHVSPSVDLANAAAITVKRSQKGTPEKISPIPSRANGFLLVGTIV